MAQQQPRETPDAPWARGFPLPEPPAEPLAPLPEDEIDRCFRSAVDAVVEDYGFIESRHDMLANRLIFLLFRDRPEYALDPNRAPTDEYRLFLQTTEESVRLDRSGLSRHIRVGALNKLLSKDPRWLTLPWTYKCELLPTLRLDATYERFQEGLAVASRPGMTLRALRNWRKSLPEAQSGKPRARGISLEGLDRLAAQGDKLGSKRARTEALKKAARLEEAERNALIDRLEESVGHMLAFIAEARASGLARPTAPEAPESETLEASERTVEETAEPPAVQSLEMTVEGPAAEAQSPSTADLSTAPNNAAKALAAGLGADKVAEIRALAAEFAAGGKASKSRDGASKSSV